MALPIYQLNSIPSPEEFNSFLRPQFNKNETEEEFPGQLRRLRDVSLSNDPTQIKGRYTAFEQELQVTAGSGLEIRFNGGIVERADRTYSVIAPGRLQVSDNALNYVFSLQGVVTASTRLPEFCRLLAEVRAAAGAITSVVNRSARFAETYQPNILEAFIGSGEQGDLVVSGTTRLSDGEYNFRNVTVANTGNLIIDGSAIIRCSIFRNDGLITVAPLAAITSTGAYPGDNAIYGGFTGSGLGAGIGDSSTNTYNYTSSPIGSSGAFGYGRGTGGVLYTLSTPGNGGGFLIVKCFEFINNGTITANASPGTPGTAPNTANTTAIMSGAGGSSGGLILIKALSLITNSATAIYNARGGDGANGARSNNTGNADGGYPGAGGRIVFNAPIVNNNPLCQINLQGGITGRPAGVAGGNLGGAAGGSFGGRGGGVNKGVAADSGVLTVRLFRPGS
jgi:hypothetical protein